MALAVEDGEPWREVETPPHAQMREADAIEFRSRPGSPNLFFIDSKSLQIGADDVVGYTLVVLASSGVLNTTFEGLRWCTLERKIYAVGRHYGSGVKSSAPPWQRISDTGYNRQHVLLADEHFCDILVPHRRPEVIRKNLRRSMRP